jgi:NAD+ kinase
MKALVVYKKSQYQIYVEERKNAHITELVTTGNEVTRGLLASHEQHNRSLDEVLKILAQEGLDVRTRYRATMDMVKDADIVFTVGGDGTLLWTQKFVGAGIPVFGINSDPTRSVGALLCANAASLRTKLRGLLDHKSNVGLQKQVVTRLKVTINGTAISSRVLNDALFCHRNPAAISNYSLRESSPEPQKSSGVWVATSAGSTGAIHSAGGQPMGLTTNLLQYLVREPFEPEQKYKHKHGFIEPTGSLILQSKMRDAIVALDGSTQIHTVAMGDVVEFSHSPEPLTLVK